ncbi:PTS transporter subunit IIC [Ezakiella peruensis]|uniref:PTS transporter subunit IIC n=1 Tax=Ezakiella peruensis TaxID=1464038 RepID=UPI000C1B0BD1|nr:PTS sugar transporter subunit IIC [Ezakiella peruensis]
MSKFLKKKGVNISAKIYFIDTLSAMAMGLFCSLLVGTILNTIGTQFNIEILSTTIWDAAKLMTGPAIAVAVAHALKAPALVIYSSIITGYIGNEMGGAVGAWFAGIIAVEVGKLVAGETKVDILVTPICTILMGTLAAITIGPVLSKVMIKLGELVMLATEMRPFFMGIVVSVIVGMVLTLPISSAALCMMIGLSGLAGGAATAGCSAQMIGFAVMSYKENGIGGLISQGLGTSMLQIPNIIKNWKIWIPPTVAAAVTGPISSVVFKMTNIPIGSGMGTSGLVGQIGTITSMTADGVVASKIYLSIALVHIILPAIISLLLCNLLKSIGWIKEGDLKL